VTIEKAARLSEEELKDKFRIGILVDREMPVFQDEYEKVRARAKELEGQK